MSLPDKVKIVEVGPRDGLQNESVFVPTPVKIEFINYLSQTGLKYIEAGSFVSKARIPQLADGEEVFAGIERDAGIDYSALVPNVKGLERAAASHVSSIAIFASASESFSQKNINCSIDESFARYQAVITEAKSHNIRVRGYLSCVLGCPYEGNVNPKDVATHAKTLVDMGVDEISLGDTIGVGTAKQTKHLVETVSQQVPIGSIAMHFHNTYGQALTNIYQSLLCGVSIFDSSTAGLGGCPYANGATGNVATEDVLYLLNGLDIDTGIDLLKIVKTGNFLCEKIGKANQSNVANALL